MEAFRFLRRCVAPTDPFVPELVVLFVRGEQLEVPGYTPQSKITYSVKWTRGNGDKPEGILVPGASVKVKDGIRIAVSETGQS